MKHKAESFLSLDTPVGSLAVGFNTRGILCFLKKQNTLLADTIILEKTKFTDTSGPIEWLRGYFQGRDEPFVQSIDYGNAGSFQRSVWEALRQIPYGDTCSYQEIARRIRKPNAVRAVANAIGANPVWIIIPCHRVIRSDGSIGGYAGGIEMKRYLLELESKGRR